MAFEYATVRFQPGGSAPYSALELTTLPRPSSGWGGTPLRIPTPLNDFEGSALSTRRLDLGERDNAPNSFLQNRVCSSPNGIMHIGLING